MSGYRITIRTGPKVERVRAETLDEALDAVELHARAAANTERRGPVDVRLRRYEAGDLVAVRVELHGRGVAAGVDVRGDGAVQAWTGRFMRRPIAPESDESVYEALRRKVIASAGTRPAP